jgi:hypothetical protein
MHALKQQLRDRTLTDREALPYYLVLTVGMCIVPLTASPASARAMLLGLLSATIAVLGVIYDYDQNGGRTGYDFIQKSIVLGWVLALRMLALMIPVAIVVGLPIAFWHPPADMMVWVEFIFSTVFICIYYMRLGKHLKETNNPVERTPTSCPNLSGGAAG